MTVHEFHPQTACDRTWLVRQPGEQKGVRELLVRPRTLAFLGVRPTALLHVGAHHGEERNSYLSLGWEAIAWVDALPSAVANLRERIGHSPKERIYEGAAFSSAGLALDFHVASNGESSSILEFQEHADVYPDITEVNQLAVQTICLSDVHDAYRQELGLTFDFVNLDIQGAELAALMGLGPRLACYKWVYSEVSTRQLYKGQPKLADLDEFLALRGFRRVVTAIHQPEGWGDALYVSERHYSRVRLGIWLVTGKLASVAWTSRQWRHRLLQKVRTMGFRA